MAPNRIVLPALLLFTAIVGGPALFPFGSVLAQEGPGMPFHEHFGSHIEGHIAFLKAELGITPAQEGLWDNVAAVMRADIADFQHLGPQEARPTAPLYLQERARLAALRAQGEQRFLEAFRPLYEKLSNAQKQKADELFSPSDEEP